MPVNSQSDVLAGSQRSSVTIRHAAAACLIECAVGPDGTYRASAVFPPEFIGFQGHFPGDSILPGVCMVETVLAVVERVQGKPVRLNTIANAKFVSPVRPGQVVAIACTSTPAEDGLKIRGELSCEARRVAELALHVTVRSG